MVNEMIKELIIILVSTLVIMNALLVLAMCKASRKADDNINEIRNK
jgi:hypothetical protein